MKMFAITHINKDGLRQLTFANQGQHHYATQAAAEQAMKNFTKDGNGLRRVLTEDQIKTVAVREVDCYDNGDAKGIYFDV